MTKQDVQTLKKEQMTALWTASVSSHVRHAGQGGSPAPPHPKPLHVVKSSIHNSIHRNKVIQKTYKQQNEEMHVTLITGIIFTVVHCHVCVMCSNIHRHLLEDKMYFIFSWMGNWGWCTHSSSPFPSLIITVNAPHLLYTFIFIQSTLHCWLPFTHSSHIHPPTVESPTQGDGQRVRSSQGEGNQQPRGYQPLPPQPHAPQRLLTITC